jgi:predicted Zn-dependent protease
MFDFHPSLKQRFAALRTSAEFFSLRYVRESGQYLSVRKNVAEPPYLSHDEGAMLTVRVNGVEAYAATNDLSQSGLQAALERAEQQARRSTPRPARPARPAVSSDAPITCRPTSTKPSRP